MKKDIKRLGLAIVIGSLAIVTGCEQKQASDHQNNSTKQHSEDHQNNNTKQHSEHHQNGHQNNHKNGHYGGC